MDRRIVAGALVVCAPLTLTTACGGDGDPSSAPGLALRVAPLELPGIAFACYDLRVRNDLEQIVWAQGDPALSFEDGDSETICSDVYGNGPGGDIAYAGPCDASDDDPGDGGVALNTATVWVDGLYDALGVDLGDWRDPCTNGCTLAVACVENADVAVTFNLTIMRRARQGFFDIAVNFEDIFCSAKVDCVAQLLHDPVVQERAATFVIAFACTAGNDQDTTLYLDTLIVDCADDERYEIVPIGPGGNLGGQLPGLFETAVYWGVEQLPGLDKCYWNTVLGVDVTIADGDPRLGSLCRLTTRASAGHTPFTEHDGAFFSPGHTAYPVIDVDLFLTDEGAELICDEYRLDDGDEIATDYVALEDADGEGFDLAMACGSAPTVSVGFYDVEVTSLEVTGAPSDGHPDGATVGYQLGRFPANSFFDVFVQLEIDGVVAGTELQSVSSPLPAHAGNDCDGVTDIDSCGGRSCPGNAFCRGFVTLGRCGCVERVDGAFVDVDVPVGSEVKVTATTVDVTDGNPSNNMRSLRRGDPIDTEMLQLEIVGTPLPGRPTAATVDFTFGHYPAESFFDVFVAVTIDGASLGTQTLQVKATGSAGSCVGETDLGQCVNRTCEGDAFCRGFVALGQCGCVQRHHASFPDLDIPFGADVTVTLTPNAFDADPTNNALTTQRPQQVIDTEMLSLDLTGSGPGITVDFDFGTHAQGPFTLNAELSINGQPRGSQTIPVPAPPPGTDTCSGETDLATCAPRVCPGDAFCRGFVTLGQCGCVQRQSGSFSNVPVDFGDQVTVRVTPLGETDIDPANDAMSEHWLTIPGGYDLFVTAPGCRVADFSPPDNNPIPPGFFGPGSQPFTGVIVLGGGPPLPDLGGFSLGPTDTLVRRLDPLEFPDPLPSGAPVQIELVGLSLVSVNPISVTYAAAPQEQWVLDVSLSLIQPSPVGMMTVQANDPAGGTFSSTLPVQPRFTFTRIQPPSGPVRTLEGPVIDLSRSGAWQAQPPAGVYVTPLTEDFFGVPGSGVPNCLDPTPAPPW